MLLLVAFHSNLMAANDGLQTVVFTESLGDVRSKLHSNTSLAGPTTRFGLWVCPQHFHHQSCLARLPLVVPIELSNIIQGDLIIREQATVQYKVFLANESR